MNCVSLLFLQVPFRWSLLSSLKIIAMLFAVSVGSNGGETINDYNTEIGVKELDKLTDAVCVPSKYKHVSCNGSALMRMFDNTNFNFTLTSDIEKYSSYLRLLNNLEYYRPHDPAAFIDLISEVNSRWVLVNERVNKNMQLKAIEVFRWVSDSWVRYHVKDNYSRFESTLGSFIDFFNTLPVWTNFEDLYPFKIVMYAYKHVRNTYYLHTKPIDNAVLETVKMIMEYPLTLASDDYIKQFFYVLYVNTLKSERQQKYFKGLYSEVKEKNVMAKIETVVINTTDHKYELVFRIHHNLTSFVDASSKIKAMFDEVEYVVHNVWNFFDTIQMPFKIKQSGGNKNDRQYLVNVYVYANKKSYETMGPLWSIETNNGGYTHVGHKTGITESHVYYETNNALPRNFGHELQHALMFASDLIKDVPLWFVEGIANRLGNRPCDEYDHNTMKEFFNNNNNNNNNGGGGGTIDRIVNATYGDTKLLYGMGSALFVFLYETRPLHVGRMLKSKNFTVSFDKIMENEFAIYQKNKIFECEQILLKQRERKQRERQLRVVNENDDKTATTVTDENSVHFKYMKAIKDFNFGYCKNYIKFEFDDVLFYMTPSKLVKVNKNQPNSGNAQRQIRFAMNDTVSLYDYNWFLKGVLKKTFEYLGDTADYFVIDRTNYSYKSNASCDKRRAIDEIAKEAVSRFAWRSGIWSSVSYLENKNYSVGSEFVRTHLRNIKSCRTFINPPVPPAGVPQYLVSYAKKMANLKIIFFMHETDKLYRLDARGNTIVHLMALNNARLYDSYISKIGGDEEYDDENDYDDHGTSNESRSGSHAFNEIKNYDGLVPRELRARLAKYINQFGKKHNKYCYTNVVEQQQQYQKPNLTTTSSPETKSTSSPEKTTSKTTMIKSTEIEETTITKTNITAAVSTLFIQSFVEITTMFESVFYKVWKNNKSVFVCILIFLFVILVNILITIFLIKYKFYKHKNKKLKEQTLRKNNRIDSYKLPLCIKEHDTCTIKLFE
ncbi:Peptidase MA superfamily [Trabala vishnou gigantina nucleopolyhedrovirus]|uniref:Peptidase MA superfamily n=1 Tax=Trabala vishnou gigantina nucleopolyhedrovirus TaxID=2863583 RepID=UPI002481B7F0|nr:Peptidase MA superfamily [Trabala vishnou gigantina nucleopolyhedrovirus]QYC92652.1 Peptidase MA superfamily [Trabala vishnou gigantina nucleopolyhedrovirus]